MTVGFAPVHVVAPLGRGDHIGEVLDRPRPDQRLPVGLAGGFRESRRDQDQVHVPHRPVKLGKAQVVAHRDPEAAVRGVHGADLVAGFDRALLRVALLAHLESEEVDLVVARRALAQWVVDQARVAHLARLARLDRHRAADEPYLVAPRLAGEERLDRPGAIALARIDLVGVLHPHDREVLGQRDDARARGRGELDQALGLLQVGGNVRARGHLDRGHAEHRLRRGHRLAQGVRGRGVPGDDHFCASTAAAAFGPAAGADNRVTTGLSHDPVTWYS